MKKSIIIAIAAVCVLIAAGIGIGIVMTNNRKSNAPANNTAINTSVYETKNVISPNIDSTRATIPIHNADPYEINLSKTELTIKKGETESFEITFENPDESSIREYIKCQDQNRIVLVKYSALKEKKINVDVEGLQVGETEISICDYEHQDKKVYVKVKVID